jgi:hypothetical protein
MQGYKVKEKTAIVPPVSKLSGHPASNIYSGNYGTIDAHNTPQITVLSFVILMFQYIKLKTRPALKTRSADSKPSNYIVTNEKELFCFITKMPSDNSFIKYQFKKVM